MVALDGKRYVAFHINFPEYGAMDRTFWNDFAANKKNQKMAYMLLKISCECAKLPCCLFFNIH